MSRPRWGHLYDFELPGAGAEAVVIVSENDWNDHTRDAVIVPAYRDRGPARGNVLIDLGDGLVADCTRVQNVDQRDIGAHRERVGHEPMMRIRLGLRTYLDVDRLSTHQEPRRPARPRSSWWPEQGQVRYVGHPHFDQAKMFAFVSDDDWNSLETTAYSASVKLTSKTHPARTRWEVGVPGGWVVAGHLYSILHDDVERTEPRSPRPSRLTVETMAEIAGLHCRLLKLGSPA